MQIKHFQSPIGEEQGRNLWKISKMRALHWRDDGEILRPIVYLVKIGLLIIQSLCPKFVC